MSKRNRERFENRPAQIALAIFSGVIAVIGLAGVTQADWFGLVYLLFGVSTVVRALNSSDVILDEDKVITRSIVRTRRYRLQDLLDVEVAVGRTGMTGLGREYLVFHRSDGQRVAFRELNSRPSKETEGPTVVQRAARAINGRLTRQV